MSDYVGPRAGMEVEWPPLPPEPPSFHGFSRTVPSSLLSCLCFAELPSATRQVGDNRRSSARGCQVRSTPPSPGELG